MNKKIIWTVVVVIIILIIIVIISNVAPSHKTGSKEFVIGGALSMTGPAAVWGETVKNGMELALQDKPGLKLIVEDTKGTPADGVSAFNRLQLGGVDLTISELSSVSAPLAKVALQQKRPLLITLSTAGGITNEYTVRYYTNPVTYSAPSFSSSSPVMDSGVKKIAVLFRNDELGATVKDRIVELAAQNKKDIVFLEAFKQNETDYLTAITKVKASGAQAFLFIDSTPGEAVGIVKMATQLKLNIPVIEASAVFADLGNRAQVASSTFYATSFDFTVKGNSEGFKQRYKAAYGKDPGFGAAFGYDMVAIISDCVNSKQEIIKCISNMDHYDGVAGRGVRTGPGDFSVTMHLEKVN